MTNQLLKFGKFKGQMFNDTPKWYQDWLLKQDWFNKTTQKSLHKQLNGWNGYSRKGEAVYDQIFEQEKAEAALYDEKMEWYKEGGFYYGLEF
jgi:hypothetical protein